MTNEQEEIAQLKAHLNEVYADRNQAALLAAVLAGPGVTVGFRVDPDEPDWPVLYIELPHYSPNYQVSWHIHKDELAAMQLGGLSEFPYEWDGHTTEEKRERIAAFVKGAFDGRI